VAYLEIQKGGSQGSAGRSLLVGSRGEAPVGVWGTSSPEAGAF
jgi:hypothetical protein